jgi:ribosome-associated translation inhibitor RaiA
MSESRPYTIICPCCEATLTVDASTGALLAHEEKKKPLASFEALAQDLDRQKHARESIFAQELNSQKDRERLLEEKFQEAFKRADKSATPFRNPLDFD